MIKLLALDIDDTLTDKTGKVSRHCIESINQAQSRGIYSVLISARPPHGVDEVARLLNGGIYRACYLGAVIQDPCMNDIQRLLIDVNVARNIAQFADRNGFSLTITIDDTEYHTQSQQRSGQTTVMSAVSGESVLSSEKPPILMGSGGYLPASSVYQYCVDCFSELICVTRHFDVNDVHASTLITHLEAQKRGALLMLCRLLSIEPHNVLAIGDSESDLRMFEIAGISVAVANAHPNVKSNATFVAPVPYGDGVAWALQKLL
jgi:hydroxymethylpyrimidine pyrophosphatase-like HAD family hydrolase